MDHFYENQVEMTLEEYLYMCNNPLGKSAVKKLRRWKTVQIAGMAIMALNVGLSLWITSYGLAGASVVLLLAFVYKYFRQRDRLNEKQYRNIRESQTTEKWIRRIIFAGDIQISDGNTVTYLRYSDIVKVDENEKYYLLYKNEDFVLRVKKGCFTLGEENRFLEFLYEKMKTAGERYVSGKVEEVAGERYASGKVEEAAGEELPDRFSESEENR